MCGTSPGPGPGPTGRESGPIFENLRDRDQPQKLRSRENGHFSRKNGFLALENSIFLTPARTITSLNFRNGHLQRFRIFTKFSDFFKKIFIFYGTADRDRDFFQKNFETGTGTGTQNRRTYGTGTGTGTKKY